MSGIPTGMTFCQTCGYSRGSVCPKCNKPKDRTEPSSLSQVFDDAVQESDEAKLQREAVDWLKANGAKGIVHHNTAKKTTCDKGVSDIIFCWQGRYIAAEAKVGTRKATQEQEEFLAGVNASGGLGFVFRSVEELRARIEQLGAGAV